MKIEDRALEIVKDGMVLGLGTGHAASAFVLALGVRVSQGLSVRGVPTSIATAQLAKSVGISLVDLAHVDHIDVTFDGADAVNPALDLIKGLGGALLREKIVAASSEFLVILVGESKLTDRLGIGYCSVLPIEVVPFGLPLVERSINRLGHKGALRLRDGQPFMTDNGNFTIDLDISAGLENPVALDSDLRNIPGVVETGLFLGMARTVLIELENGTVDSRSRPPTLIKPSKP
jgi:ribose 5-phosphate isomerase A